jgi:hypothetical protein
METEIGCAYFVRMKSCLCESSKIHNLFHLVLLLHCIIHICANDAFSRFKDELPELVQAFKEKVVPPETRTATPEPDEVMIKPEPKAHRTKPKAVRKPTLTEADLIDGRSTIITSKPSSTRSSTPSTSTSVTTGGGKGDRMRSASLVRSRSISVEPTDGENGRRSRSRSVSLAAEEIKAVGGKRGGIAGNSKIFANEVEMRRQASGSGRMGLKKATSTSTSTSGGDGNDSGGGNDAVVGASHRKSELWSTLKKIFFHRPPSVSVRPPDAT